MEHELRQHIAEALTCGSEPLVAYEAVTKSFSNGQVVALDGVSFEVCRGGITGLVGPDGAGKTTLLRLATGLLFADSGTVLVHGIDAATSPQEVQSRVGYMPQKFGLYEDLTVKENLDLYGDLYGISPEERSERYPQLMRMTGLGRFMGRLAGRLSGGMKQKLGLACTLLSSPELLLLDEPTVGVDPLSRQDLWKIIHRMVAEQGLTVLVSTSYLDEAEKCDTVVVLHKGKILGAGAPSSISSEASGRSYLIDTPPSLKPRQLQSSLIRSEGVVDATLEGNRVRLVSSGNGLWQKGLRDATAPLPAEPRFEDGFMILLRRAAGDAPAIKLSESAYAQQRSNGDPGEAVVEVRDLVKKFGDFYAVKGVSFQVRRGEIFGLLGPNGAGKSTTFRMLCGLMPASSGSLSVAGVNLGRARASARQRIGYVAQKFSLYGQLSVIENLRFFASAYNLRGGQKRARVEWAVEQFELQSHIHQAAGLLPGGFKQRLAMACALMHEPEILFLDEATSGVDPIARREFWYRISALADSGVTVVITTHFMEEAEYCDRMVIMVDGEVLAEGAPMDIRRRARASGERQPTMEDAFIAIVEDSQAASG